MSHRKPEAARTLLDPRWIAFRRACQIVLPLAILIAPLLGGWQRFLRSELTAWHSPGWDLPAWIRENLPEGDAPAKAYEALVVSGGGMAADFGGLPLVDPLVGSLAIASGAWISLTLVLATAATITLGLLGGRIFCGWFCPFGTLGRVLEGLLSRIGWAVPRVQVTDRRWFRYALLAAVVVASLLGATSAVYPLLPHFVLQQSVYALWLMGGFGAAAGALAALVIVGMVFGPTTYCTLVCPTGATLALAGRARRVHLTLIDAGDCGHGCDLCDRACWLSLTPSIGDPGPDCDVCGRCAQVCPSNNLRLRARSGAKVSKLAVTKVAILLLVVLGGGVAGCGAEEPWRPSTERYPKLLLESRESTGAVDVEFSLVDMRGVELDANDGVNEQGVEVSVYLARGENAPADALGRPGARDVYRGPLRLVLTGERPDADVIVDFRAPTSPVSTPNRSLYRQRVAWEPRPGASIRLEAIDGWTTTAREWRIPQQHPSGGLRFGLAFFGGLLFYGGLVSLAAYVAAPRE
jgi:ferredoxin-type protein NapH